MSTAATNPQPDTREIVWQGLDPNYLKLRRITVWLSWLPWVAGAAVVVGLMTDWRWAVAVAVVGIVWTAYRFTVQPRKFAAWGYAVRDTDLYIRHGLWFKEMTVVPFGRMQMVTMNSGPIEHRFGLATVSMKTASTSSDAEIPGLRIAEAERLRDLLSELGEQQAVSL